MPHERITVPEFARVGDYAGIWAMEPRAFRVQLDAMRAIDLTAHAKDAATPRLVSQIERIQTGGGRQVAVVKILGSLMKQSSSMGGTSTVQLRRDIRTAANDPDVSAILLAIDSPGGTVAGTADLAAEVKAAGKKKPVWAFIDDLGASAAFWVASQAEKVFANDATALVGSIGTLMVVYDVSSAADAAGIQARVFATGPLKGAGVEGAPITPEQADYFQGMVDESQKSFDAAVQRGRQLTDKQLEKVRTGGVFSASEAINLKLIDGIQTFDATVSALASAARKFSTTTRGQNAVEHTETEIVSALPVAPSVQDTIEARTLAAAKAAKDATQAAIEQARAAAAAEATRQADVRRICAEAGNPAGIEAKALADGWDAMRTELECLRVSRPAGPGIISRSHDRDCTIEALQAAMLLRSRGRLDHKAYTSGLPAMTRLPRWLRSDLNSDARQQVMELAHGYSQMSLMDVAREAIRLDGRTVPHNRNEMLQAAFSGGSLTNIFTTNVNAVMLATFMEAGDSTTGWTREKDVADFKTVERPRLVKGSGLAKLPRGGEADHMSRSDKMESYKIARYAGQIVIDEQDFIDDSLGAIADFAPEMGLASARLRPDLAYYILLSNPTLNATSLALFHATNGNLLTSSALTAATLRTAVKTMRLFQENSVNLNVQPTHLLLPQALFHLGTELTKSQRIQITGSERGDFNALVNDGITPVGEARLENGVTDPATGTSGSGSSTTWFLASNQMPTIEVAFLLGTGRAPQVRSFTLSQGQWGMGWDIAMDIGAKAMEWRGLVKCTA